VTNSDFNSVSVIYVGNNTVIATVVVGAHPINLALKPNGASA